MDTIDRRLVVAGDRRCHFGSPRALSVGRVVRRATGVSLTRVIICHMFSVSCSGGPRLGIAKRGAS
jgi:hypothetical protein